MNHRLVFVRTYLALTQVKYKVSHHVTQRVLSVYKVNFTRSATANKASGKT